jgi:tRNA(Ile)-lysidine synthase
MRPKAGTVVRPLLAVGRPEVQEFLADRDIRFRNDVTNQDLRIPRNRVRHEVLPALEAAVPGAVGGLGRLAAIVADEDGLLASLAAERGRGLVREAPGGLAVSLSGLEGEPTALRRRIVAGLIESPRVPGLVPAATLRHVDAVLELVSRGREGARLSLPGRTAEIRGNELWVVSKASFDGCPPPSEPAVRQIPVPGVLRDTDAGWELTAEVGAPMDAAEAQRYCAAGERAVVDFATVGSKVYVRYRRPGDRFRPLGMRGHRKLQDVFVDAKVSRALRDRVPLVVDEADRIVWVVGHGIAADTRATGRATGVLLLGFRRLGGLG